MKALRVVLMIFCLCLLSQKASADPLIFKPGESNSVEVGQTVIIISNNESKHKVIVVDKNSKQIKMFLDFILPGFKMGMSFDEFGGKKVSISCERNDIKLEIN